MSDTVERVVSFEPVDQDVTRLHQIVRFAIQPPIKVHDPHFLDRAIREEVQAGASDRYYELDRPIVEGVALKFTDEIATYGLATVITTADPSLLQEVIVTAFGRELNQLGSLALSFNFGASFSQSRPH